MSLKILCNHSMTPVYFATNNEHKVSEVQSILGDTFDIKSLKELGCTEDIPETGVTFEENAKQKTDYLVDHYQVSCFADDSGLEVDALDLEPGVYSARYAGTRDMDQNIALLLNKLAGKENRTARFRTVISLNLEGQQYFFDGSIEGKIIDQLRGENGFGYDPIFVPDGYSETFAEMSLQQKNEISHRSIAVEKLAGFLKSLKV